MTQHNSLPAHPENPSFLDISPPTLNGLEDASYALFITSLAGTSFTLAFAAFELMNFPPEQIFKEPLKNTFHKKVLGCLVSFLNKLRNFRAFESLLSDLFGCFSYPEPIPLVALR